MGRRHWQASWAGYNNNKIGTTCNNIKLRQGGEGRGGDTIAVRLRGGDVGQEGGNGGGDLNEDGEWVDEGGVEIGTQQNEYKGKE